MTSNQKLFGTDGIRGVAGQFPLRSRDVYRLGQCAGFVLRKKSKNKSLRILIVRDTRQSGRSLSKKLIQGLRQSGVDAYDAGVLNTPSVAFLVQNHKFQSGVVISASHNPPEFNGIKFFTSQGRKWPDEWEKEVEKFFYSKLTVSRGSVGVLVPAHSLEADYQNFLVGTLAGSRDFSSLRLAVDCSHGANSQLAPRVFKELGARVFVMGAKPSGLNINVGCGSQHTKKLSRLVLSKKCDAGIAFDGDGDRVVFVDEKGCVVDGDYTLAILARHFKKQKKLRNNTVVTTVMANLGLKKVLKDLKVRYLDVAVGDRYVSDGMRKAGAVLGGEQSGHIILGRYLPTGDGLLTSLHVMAALLDRREPFSKVASFMKKFPQVLVNVEIKKRIPLDQLDGVSVKIKEIERILGSDGRVFVRYSGTEPLLRIMLEGPDKQKLDYYSGEIAHAVTRAHANHL